METKAFKEDLSRYLGHLAADAEEFGRTTDTILNAIVRFLWEMLLHMQHKKLQNSVRADFPNCN